MKPVRAAHTQKDENGKRIPIRTCVSCRARLPQSTVLRLAKDGSGHWQLDPTRRMTGRGTYICTNSSCHLPKALMRLSRAEAPRLAVLLENHFKPL
jgi:predicted RNA-binding protein YlxR (DUF448 family)